MDPLYIGVDVGTGSARAGLFNARGELLASEAMEIKMWKPKRDFVEQSSENIWNSVVFCVQEILKKAGVSSDRVKGLGFDATCSLVCLDESDRPVTVSPSGEDSQNVIVWMDHRAKEYAEIINRTEHSVLEFVGKKISPEMELPKLLWLKNHLPDSWIKTKRFFDLPDYLTYRATGKEVRSLCSTVCKWTYLGHEGAESKDNIGHWSDSFFREIGLGDLVNENYARVGNRVRPVGERISGGLCSRSANELGLLEGTAVGVSIIDAHAGGLGMIGMDLKGQASFSEAPEKRLALIGGTSSCHMAVSKEPKFIEGVWGPYFSAMVPDLWLTEGGQSATGSLVDHVVFHSPGSNELIEQSREEGVNEYEYLNEVLDRLCEGKPMAWLTENFHVCPYFHGNRSPRANPNLVGMLSGLHLSTKVEDLAILYLATIQAIAYGTRHIIEEMNEAGFSIDLLCVCGGGCKNPVFLQQHADITGCSLVQGKEPESVLLGSAMIGAYASGGFSTLEQAMKSMASAGKTTKPELSLVEYHSKKYKVFHKLYEDQRSYKKIMDSPLNL